MKPGELDAVEGVVREALATEFGYPTIESWTRKGDETPSTPRGFIISRSPGSRYTDVTVYSGPYRANGTAESALEAFTLALKRLPEVAR